MDIRTLVFIVGATHLMQVLVFYHQYRVNKTYNGIGWWLLWSAAECIGFGALLLRNVPSLLPFMIIIQNTMIVLGTLFIYIGIKRFFNSQVNWKLLTVIILAFTTGLHYFLFIDENIEIRSVIINGTLAVMSFLTAQSLFASKIRSIRASSTFNGIVFIVHGSVFVIRTIMIVSGYSNRDFLVPTLFNFIPFFDALIVSLLWTFGFIIMVNNRLNAEVSDSREQFQQIFTTGPDAAIITRVSDGLIVDHNLGYMAITGYSREDLAGKSTLDINLWKNIRDRNNVIRILREQGYCENYEATFVRKNGVEITGLMSARLLNLLGEPHIISISRDITERKRMEESLRESNEYLENLINYANAPIIVWNPQFRITRFNHAFEFLTGFTEAEVTGKTLQILFPPESAESSMALIRKTLTGERWESVEIKILHHLGSVRTVLWNSANIFSPDGITLLATIAQGQDITARTMAEEHLRMSEETLRQINAEKDKFFSVLAHDLRSPFNSLLGLTQMLDEELSILSAEEIARLARNMRKSAVSLYRLLDNLLEWSRIQRGMVSFHPVPCQVKPIILEALDVVTESARNKSIELLLNIDDNLTIKADSQMISTVVRNLAFNAVKFTWIGGKVTVSAVSLKNGSVNISVSDTGIGMSPEFVGNLFRLDSPVSRPGTAGEPSTGLGLIICKEFVEKHGGELKVWSEEGHGSILSFSLPLDNQV